MKISPGACTVQVGQSQQFAAAISGTNNTAINWLVNGILGGNSTLGTISSSGMYGAPSAVPPSQVAVTAQSAVDTTASASATVSITQPPPISVSISPTSASVQVGQSQQFAAAVSGTNNTAVNWLVNGVLGGNSTLGTISSSGMYGAPSAVPPSQVAVTAQSNAQSTASASATVSITPPPPISVSISPTSASLQVGQSSQFSATVSGTSNTGVAWLVNGILGGSFAVGTISSSGMYAAPSAVPSNPVAVTVQSNAQSTSSASATVLILPATVSVSISPTNSSVQVGQSEQFSATVSGAGSSAVNWLVSGIPGGNSSAGTITSAGLYTAPASVPSGSVAVTAQSSANPSSSASASVTITQPVPHYVSLAWTASSSSVAGYNIYRGAQSTGPFARINSFLEPATAYTDNAVVSGQIYYYATTAVDSSGLESGYSNLAQAVIP